MIRRYLHPFVLSDASRTVHAVGGSPQHGWENATGRGGASRGSLTTATQGLRAAASARLQATISFAQPLDEIANQLPALRHHQPAGNPAPSEGAVFTPSLTVGASTDPSKEGTI